MPGLVPGIQGHKFKAINLCLAVPLAQCWWHHDFFNLPAFSLRQSTLTLDPRNKSGGDVFGME